MRRLKICSVVHLPALKPACSSAMIFSDGLAEEEKELAKLAERLNKAPTAYGMEISAKKTRLMTNNTSGINT